MMATLTAARRFLSTYEQLLGTHLRRRPRELSLIGLLTAAGALAQGGVVAVLVGSIRLMQTSEPGVSSLQDFIVEHRVLTLVMISALLSCTLYIGVWASYQGAVRTRAIARAFHQYCIVDILSRLQIADTIFADDIRAQRGFLRRLVIRSGLHLGKAMEASVLLLEPVMRLLVALGLLLWISPLLTLVFIPVFVMALPVMYRSTTVVHDDAKAFYDHAAVEMMRFSMRLMNAITSQSGPRQMDLERQIARQFEQTPETDTYFEAYDRLQLAQARTQFALSVVTSGMMVLVMLIVSSLAAAKTLDWALALGYLLALMHLLQATNMMRSYVTSLSVFYPAALRYRRLLEASGQSTDSTTPNLPDEIVLTATVGAETSSKPVRRGEAVLVGGSLEQLANPAREEMRLATTSGHSLPEDPGCTRIGVNARATAWLFQADCIPEIARHTLQQLRTGSVDDSVARELEKLEAALAAGESPAWDCIPACTQLALILADIRGAHPGVILIAGSWLRELDAECWNTLVRIHHRDFIIVAQPKLTGIPNWFSGRAIVQDASGRILDGDWQDIAPLASGTAYQGVDDVVEDAEFG